MAERDVSLMKLVTPEWLSLVGSPANQSGFKIIRSTDNNEGNMAHSDRNSTRRLRQRRADPGLMSLDFPTGIERAEAEELFDAFALGEDYELVEDDGAFHARRTTASDEESTAIDMGKGVVAHVTTSSITRGDKSISGVTLVGLEFGETFDAEHVKRWMEERDINHQEGGVETFEGGTMVTRHDTPDKVEVRKVRLGDDVQGLVAKTADTDVPQKVYRSVIEQSYGNWGWGHLNFGTALADPAFSDASWDAIWVLRDVLENIVLYSGMPLDERKILVQNACDQFVTYLTGLIDALPSGVIEQTRADRNNQRQETDDMAKKDTDDKKVTRSEGDDADNKATDKQDGDKGEGTEYVTRSELADTVTAAVTAAFAAQRGDDDKGDDAAAASKDDDKEGDKETVKRDDDKDDSGMNAVAAALEKLGTGMDAIVKRQDDLAKEVEDLGGSTVTRTDDDDSSDDLDDGDKVKRRDGQSCFAGMMKGQLYD